MGRFLKLLLVALILKTSAATSKGSIILKNSIEYRSQTSDSIIFILKNSTSTKNTNIGIRIEAESKLIKSEFQDFVSRFLKNNDRFPIDLNSLEGSFYNIHARLYFVDSVQSLEKIIARQRKYEKNPSNSNQHCFIFLPEGIQNAYEVVRKMIKLCWKNFIVDVNIVVGDEHQVVTFYTYEPFSEGRCRDTTPRVHNRFLNGSFEFSKPNFPLKNFNFWKCPLKAIVSHNPPYFSLNDWKMQPSGMEVELLSLMSKYLNFSLEFVVSRKGRGAIYSNGTVGPGAFKLLLDGQGDFEIGETSCFGDAYAMTTPYYSSTLKVVVKRSQELDPLFILLFPFDTYTWIICITFFFIKRISSFIWTKKVHHNPMRLPLIAWLFGILILRSSYEGSVFKFLRNGQRKPLPTSLQEALNENYKIFCDEKCNFFAMQGFLKDDVNLIRDDSIMFGILEKFSRTMEKYGVVTVKGYLAAYNNDPSKYNEFVILQEPILHNIDCIYFQKFSYLREPFSISIDMLKIYGYISRIIEKSLSIDNFQKKKENDGVQDSMSLHKLRGSFELLAIFSAVNVCVFVMEVLSKFCPILKRIIDVFH